MPTLLQGGHRLEYELEKTSPRKTLSLRVHRDGRIAVKSPAHLRLSQVRDFVGRKSAWIARRRSYFGEMMRRHPPKELKNGESFPVLGRNYRLRLASAGSTGNWECRIEGRRLNLRLPGSSEIDPARAWSALRGWYGALTLKRVQAAVRKHAPSLAAKPGAVCIVSRTNRWASCARNGDIRCNWKLSMMPTPVLEYVVAHELCHLQVRTHSPRFWRILKSVLPDYEKRRDWLKEHGPGIAFSI